MWNQKFPIQSPHFILIYSKSSMAEDIPALIEQFGANIRNFSFDKAKDIVDEFRTAKLISSAPGGGNGSINSIGQDQFTWNSLIQCLPQLAVTEKSYMSLSFLVPKGFLRRESALRSNYCIIRSELSKIGENLSCDVPDISPPRQTVVAHLASQLKRFIDARIDLITLYERLSAFGASSKTIAFDDSYVISIDDINERYGGAFTHPLISGIVANLLSECEILANLLKCHGKLSLLMFIDSLLNLKNAQSTLKLVSRSSSSSDLESSQGSNWFGFSSSAKAPVLPPLFLWHKRYYDTLLSKFSLYFHDLLLKQTSPQDMRNQLSKTPDNYLQRIGTFHRKQDASFVCLILNADGLTHSQWQGYHHSDHKIEPLKGLENYPIVLSFPTGQERPPNLLPSAVMIINEQTAKLSSLDGTASVYDDTKDVSYFVCRVETQLYLLVTFKGRKNERDSHVATFMHDLCADLRCVKVFAALKATAKT